MKKLLIILLCFPLIGLGQCNKIAGDNYGKIINSSLPGAWGVGEGSLKI